MLTPFSLSPSTLRPELLALVPERLVAGLRPHEIVPRVLTWQTPHPQPQHGSWGVLPSTSVALVIDFTSLGIIATARTLIDLRHEQRVHEHIPLLLVPRAAWATQRLIASSHVSALILAAESSPATLARWLTASLRVQQSLTWVGVHPIEIPSRSSHFVPLLAALARANTMPQAAAWCNISGRRAYEILADAAVQLRLPPYPRRTPRQWLSAISRACTAPPVSAAATSHIPMEERMGAHRFDTIAANVCGCVIEHIHQDGQRISFDLEEPHTGSLTLTCENATMLDANAYVHFDQRARWARTIDWVDLLDDTTLHFALANGSSIVLRAQTATFERAIGQ